MHLKRTIRSHATAHPISTALFVLSIASLIVLLPTAWSLYRSDPTAIVIIAGSLGDGTVLKKMLVRVTRIVDGPDKLQVIVTLEPALRAGKTTLYVSVPQRFACTGSADGNVTIREAATDRECKDYHVAVEDNNVISGVTFDCLGEILPTRTVVETRIGLFAHQNGREIPIPAELTVADVGGIAFDELLPEPEERTSRFLWYTSEPWREKIADGVVTLRGSDRSAATREQFLLFVVATLIGVFASIAVGLIQAFASEYERQEA